MINSQIMIETIKLCKRFAHRSSITAQRMMLTAVDHLNITLHTGETLGIAGESGCGKSTLAKLVAGLLEPDEGKILHGGVSLAALTPVQRRQFHQQVQMVFQDPFSSLNPRMRIGDTIAEPLLIQGMGRAAAETEALRLLETMGMTAEQARRFPDEFSGGQRQRIGIARALASSPSILVADEPVSSLDISIQAQIINLLLELRQSRALTMLLISHDLSVLHHLCNRIGIMYLGSLVEIAPTDSIFDRARHPYTEALLAAIPSLNAKRDTSVPLLTDDLPSPLHLPSGCRFHPRCRYAQQICKTTSPLLEERSPGHLAACHFPLSTT